MEYGEYKEMRDTLKERWKDLWTSRIDDKVRAEGVSSEDFPELFTDRGEIIFATRDYKPPAFNEILEKYFPQDVVDKLNPSPYTGGIRKFIKETISKNKVARRKNPLVEKKTKNKGLKKHGGQGWLHKELGLKK